MVGLQLLVAACLFTDKVKTLGFKACLLDARVCVLDYHRKLREINETVSIKAKRYLRAINRSL